MTDTEERLADRLDDLMEMAPGEAQINTARELVRDTETSPHREAHAYARLLLIEALIRGAQSAEDVPAAMTAFVRCLTLCREEPEAFSPDAMDLLWREFGVLGVGMLNLHTWSARQIRGVLDDMQPRCRPESDDLSLLYMLRMGLEARAHNLAAADAALRRLRGLGTPEYMNPAAPMLTGAQYLARQGRDEEAIAEAAPLLSGQVPAEDAEGNTVDPRDRLAVLLMSYLRTGRLEEARELHRRTWRGDDEDDLAANLEFCARSGNEDRGVRIVARLAKLDAPVETVQEMRLTAALALLSRRMVELGRGSQTVPASGGEGPEWTFATCLAETSREALEFARKLDAADGTTHQAGQVRALIDAEPVVPSLPLGPIARARQRLTGQQARQRPAEVPPDPGELLHEAERAAQLWRRRDDIRELLRRFDDAVGTPAPGLQAAQRAELGAVCAVDDERENGLRRAAELYQEAGEELRAQVCRGRLSAIHHDAGGSEEARALLDSAARYLEAHGDRFHRSALEFWRAAARRADGDTEGALAAYGRAHDLVAEDGDDPTRAATQRGRARYDRAGLRISQLRGTPAGEAGADAVAAITDDADEAARQLAAAGNGDAEAAAHVLRALAARLADDSDAALAACQDAVAVGSPQAEATVTARAMRGSILVDREELTPAIPELVEAVAGYTALGDDRALHARVELAMAYSGVERWLDAAEAAEEALADLSREEDRQEDTLQAEWTLARAYEALGRPEDALAALDRMAERATGDPGRALVESRAAHLLWDLDRDSEAAARAQEAAAVFGRLGDPAAVVHHLSMASRALTFAGRHAEARDSLQPVWRATLDLPEEERPGHQAHWYLLAAQLLGITRDLEAAADHAETAARRFDAVGDPEQAATARLHAARLHLDLERPDAASAVLRRVVDQFPEEAPQHAEALDLLDELRGQAPESGPAL